MRIEDLSVEHHEAHVNGVRLHYVEKSPPNVVDPPLCVLLHGFPELWWSWRHQIDAIVALGYRVIAPDLRGYADSEKHGPFDIDTLATDVTALITFLGRERAVIVAHDWGGAIAWHLAATQPSFVERLVIINAPHGVMFAKALRSKWSQVKRSWYMFAFLLPALPEHALVRDDGALVAKILRSAAKDRTHLGDEELAPYRAAVQKPGAAHGMVSYYRAALRGSLRDRKRLSRYPKVHAKTLVIWGMDDVALGFDDVMRGTEKYVDDLTIVQLEGVGHFAQMEAPGKVNPPLLAFLRRDDSAQEG